MKLDPQSLTVDSFDLGQDGPSAVLQPGAPLGPGDSRYCSLINTCATCYTDCPCA
jgi:hypothetical protein